MEEENGFNLITGNEERISKPPEQSEEEKELINTLYDILTNLPLDKF